MRNQQIFANSATVFSSPMIFSIVGQTLKLNADTEQTSAITNLSCLLYLQFLQVSCW